MQEVEQRYAGEGARSVATPRPQRRSDSVRENADRLVARISSARASVSDLLERIGAPYPPEPDVNTKDVLNASGFVPSVDVTLDRAHGELGRLEELLRAIGDVI
jgi:hypothetical protein